MRRLSKLFRCLDADVCGLKFLPLECLKYHCWRVGGGTTSVSDWHSLIASLLLPHDLYTGCSIITSVDDSFVMQRACTHGLQLMQSLTDDVAAGPGCIRKPLPCFSTTLTKTMIALQNMKSTASSSAINAVLLVFKPYCRDEFLASTVQPQFRTKKGKAMCSCVHLEGVALWRASCRAS